MGGGGGGGRHLYMVKLGCTRVYIIFLIFALKHRLWGLIRTANIYTHHRAKLRIIRIFQLKIVFLQLKKISAYYATWTCLHNVPSLLSLQFSVYFNSMIKLHGQMSYNMRNPAFYIFKNL